MLKDLGTTLPKYKSYEEHLPMTPALEDALCDAYVQQSKLLFNSLIGVPRGSLLPLSLFPDQGSCPPDLGKIQVLDVFFLAHYLGDAVHGGRELCH